MVERDCLQWYMMDADDEESQAFVGINDGQTKIGMLRDTVQVSKNCYYNYSTTWNTHYRKVSTPFF